MSRRLFEHLLAEISVAIGVRISRYGLWLCLREEGFDPEALTRSAVLAFCEGPLEGFLAERGHPLGERGRRRLLRSVARFDPTRPTPEERLSDWS